MMLARLDHVKKQYRDFTLDCSMEIPEDCVTGLIGANGAGKSTTFKTILGLVKPDSGRIQIFGRDSEELDTEDRREIGTVLSDSFFSGYLTARQIADFIGEFYPGFQKQAFEKQCTRFQVPMDKKVREFSTGMKAKLKVLTAMSYGARFLILDEPTVGLDVMARESVLDLFREYMEVPGRGILISSHISSDLEQFCDEIYMIHDGKIILQEETDAILGNYGVIKAEASGFASLDKRHILRIRKESFGYSCLTDQRQFYQENYPELTVEKGTVDEVLTMMAKGEAL